MEARYCRVAGVAAVTVLLAIVSPDGQNSQRADAAGYKTANFVVSAPTAGLAKEIGDAAEIYRRNLALEWIGEEMPTWTKPCPISAKVAPRLGAGGATSFIFDRGEVFGWKMNIQGSRERVLDSVLPHEITHTIFASYFRQPLPRWADEGACTTVEHRSEIAKQERMLIDFLKTGRGIPFNDMFAMKEYPQDVMPLYSQGHATAQWLIEQRGKKEFMNFLTDGLRDGNWPRAVQAHYSFSDLYAMQNSWLDWVKQGRPQLTPTAGTPGIQLASNATPVYRGQSPDDDITPVREERRDAEPLSMAGSAASVYAAAAERARANLSSATTEAVAAARPAESIYDASRQSGAIRR